MLAKYAKKLKPGDKVEACFGGHTFTCVIVEVAWPRFLLRVPFKSCGTQDVWKRYQTIYFADDA